MAARKPKPLFGSYKIISSHVSLPHRPKIQGIVDSSVLKVLSPKGGHFFFGIHTISQEIEKKLASLGVELTAWQRTQLQNKLNSFLKKKVEKKELVALDGFPFPDVSKKAGARAFCLPENRGFAERAKKTIETKLAGEKERLRLQHHADSVSGRRSTTSKKKGSAINRERLFKGMEPGSRKKWIAAFERTVTNFFNSGAPMTSVELVDEMIGFLRLRGVPEASLKKNREGIHWALINNMKTFENRGFLKIRQAPGSFATKFRQIKEFVPLKNMAGEAHIPQN